MYVHVDVYMYKCVLGKNTLVSCNNCEQILTFQHLLLAILYRNPMKCGIHETS